ncbi:HSPB11 [Bugula neritina]|uniref:HSPB11 n=1 Tax=Bugula neritina TaxID=10212 RepID=A0A7J7JDC7_BUGNE|nr:HSPB11 [Bugula neritina]
MFNIGLGSAGTTVSLASSSDSNFPPENIIDGKLDTFWLTTGMFPQEFVLSFTSTMAVNNVKLNCHNVRKLSLEKSVETSPVSFEVVREASLEGSDGELQIHEFNLSDVKASHLKFKIESGYNHFVSIHELNIEGSASRM